MPRIALGIAVAALASLMLGCIGTPAHTFDKYDFAFDYRADTEATSEKGRASAGSFRWAPDNNSLFYLTWYEAGKQPDTAKDIMEESVQGSTDAARAWAEVHVYELEQSWGRILGVTVDWEIYGQPGTELMSGYRVSYQSITSRPGSGLQGAGITAIWYCEDIDKVFVLDIEAPDALKKVREFLRGFELRQNF